MPEDPLIVWQEVAAVLRRRMPERTFAMWLEPLEPTRVEDGLLELAAPPQLLGWISDRFVAVLQSAAREVLGPRADIRVVSSEEPPPGSPAGARAVHAPHAVADLPALREPELNPACTFGSFVMGKANRFAHAAALAVAELPGQSYNPLFLHGPPGTGKTHLLHAIGHYVRRYGGGLTVRVTTAEAFTNEFLAALRSRTGGAHELVRFKGHYRLADVVLVDDVQFLEDKASTEEEFFHTFNALQEAGAQLVLTSDRTPADLDALNARLRERFAAGLVVDLDAPDEATRRAVLRRRVLDEQLDEVEDAVLDRIVDRVRSDVRALHGALIRVVAFASLTGRPITPALADEVLDGLYGPARRPSARPRLDTAGVQALVCDAFSLSRDELVSTSRAREVAWARQLAMYLARQHTGESLPSIGRAFGRSHTTVLAAVRSAAKRLEGDAEARDLHQELTRKLLTGARPPARPPVHPAARPAPADS